MNKAGSRVNIIILDACRNNPFRGFFRSQEGLAAMHAPDGTIISYATALGKKASDGEGRNGLYTEQLLAAIQTPGLSIEKVFKQTATGVKQKSGGQQVPWVSTSLTGKDFCFTLCQQAPSVDISQLLHMCKMHYKANHLTSGRGGTALACYEEVLKKEPLNLEAVAGIEKIEARYISWIKRALDSGQTERAKRYLASLRLVNPESPQLVDFEARLQASLSQISRKAESSVNKKVFRDRLKDGSLGPEMVWIPAGSFRMGKKNLRDLANL
ncbi:peptidase C14 caspase catalytic subunit p20 [Candidatus Thiomargarita nelsonii]|uniref:Peptidase C14 caspase catalytic subunit p20 n=1 Tax=Candidatus Thiomargarita nelsonii TaxID=1003181 RepID=A0A176S2E1_9GAMM|nr:peptidase C14 caspase catalytic subunit p20 [Candidatus Thiomargarita nelsonii]